MGGILVTRRNQQRMGSGWEKILTLTALVLLGSLALYARTLFYFEPQDTDNYCYVGIGHELLKGRALYSDLWDVKPPAVFLTYAATEKLVGFGRPTIFFLNIFFDLLTMVGIYACGQRIGKGQSLGLMAAALWTLVSFDPALQANQPNTELFINAFLVWAFLLLLELGHQKSRAGTSLVIGALWAVATLYKQTPIITAVFCCGAHLWSAKDQKERSVAFRQVLFMGSMFLAVWTLFFLYFALTQRGSLFYSAIFGYNLAHSSPWSDLWSGLTDHFFPSVALFLLPMFILTLGGLFLGGRGGDGPRPYLLAFLLAVPIEVSIRGTFYQHYYQLWFPVLCLGAVGALQAVASRWGRVPAAALAMTLVLFLGVREWKWTQLPLWQTAQVSNFVGFAPEVGSEIRRTLLPGEDYYEWTYNLYFNVEAGKGLVTGVPHGMFLFLPPMGPELSNRTVRQLEERKPELLVFATSFRMPGMSNVQMAENPVFRYLIAHYVPYRDMEGGKLLFCYLKGGHLEKRVEAQGKNHGHPFLRGSSKPS